MIGVLISIASLLSGFGVWLLGMRRYLQQHGGIVLGGRMGRLAAVPGVCPCPAGFRNVAVVEHISSDTIRNRSWHRFDKMWDLRANRRILATDGTDCTDLR